MKIIYGTHICKKKHEFHKKLLVQSVHCWAKPSLRILENLAPALFGMFIQWPCSLSFPLVSAIFLSISQKLILLTCVQFCINTYIYLSCLHSGVHKNTAKTYFNANFSVKHLPYIHNNKLNAT